MNDEFDLEEFAPWLVVILALVGGFLRTYLLSKNTMWLDETFSVWLANMNVSDMLQWIVKIDQHPPLYYLLLHYWVAFKGDTPYYARLLSVWIGVATVPVLYLIGKRMSGTIMGLAAAAIMAFSPYHIFYGQETRMYTLLTFNASVAIYALVRLLTDPRSVKPIGSQFLEYLRAWRNPPPAGQKSANGFSYEDIYYTKTGWQAWKSRHQWLPIKAVETDLAWITFIVFSAATMLSHNTAILFPVAANVYVLGLILYQRIRKTGSPPSFQAPSFWSWVTAQVGILLLWSPWIIAFIRQVGSVDQRFWIPKPTWDSVLQVIRAFLNASGPDRASQNVIMWFLYALLILGLLHFRRKWSRFLFLATLFVIPFVAELIVSIRRPIFYDRTLIWTTIPLFLMLAAGIAQLRIRLLVLIAVGVVCTNYLFTAGDYYRYFQKEDWATPAGYVANFAENDDLVLFNSNFVEIPFNYYFEQYEKQYSIEVEKQGVPADLIKDGILEPLMTENDIPTLISYLDGHDRVWLVYSHDSYTDPTGIIPRVLASKMKLVREREFYGGKVQLYETP